MIGSICAVLVFVPLGALASLDRQLTHRRRRQPTALLFKFASAWTGLPHDVSTNSRAANNTDRRCCGRPCRRILATCNR